MQTGGSGFVSISGAIRLSVEAYGNFENPTNPLQGLQAGIGKPPLDIGDGLNSLLHPLGQLFLSYFLLLPAQPNTNSDVFF